MNRYRELIDAIDPSEGFKDRLSEDILSHMPGTKKIYRPRTAIQTLALIICIAATLTVTAGAAYLAVNWDPIFMKRFSPTENQASQLGNATGNDNSVSKCGDVTLRVRQTLGDDRTIYIILDVTLPASVPLDELISTDASGKPHLDIFPQGLYLGSAALTYEDVAGKSFDDYRAAAQLLGQAEGTSTVRADSVDFETNTLTYLIWYSPETETVSGQPLSILIDRLVGDLGKTTVAEGPFLISWTPVCTGESRTYDIMDGGNKVGWVTISPLALKGELYQSDCKSFDDFAETVSLTLKNGKSYLPENAGTGGSFGMPGGSASFNTQFREILLIDDIVSIHMGGFTVELS